MVLTANVRLRGTGYGFVAGPSRIVCISSILHFQSSLYIRAFHKPQDLEDASLDTVFDRLESFWESEVPRAGEAGAIGWAAWEASGCPEAIPIPSRAPPRVAADSDPYSRWASEELLVDRSSQMPLRSFDDEANNDPYSTILFSDIRPLLVNLSHTGSRQAFRLIWLSFLGLHLPGFSMTLATEPTNADDYRWSATHLTANTFVDRLFPEDSSARYITADSFYGVAVGRERVYTHPFGPVKQWSLDAIDPLDAPFGGLCRLWTREDMQKADQSLVRYIFSQCRLSEQDEDWDILRLAFEGAIDPKQ